MALKSAVEKIGSTNRIATPSDLSGKAVKEIGASLNLLLADVFALYFKTKNFHWHVSGPHFRDYHLLFDEQAEQLFAMTDVIAERVRKIGGVTLHSVGEIADKHRIKDNDKAFVDASDMISELCADNSSLLAHFRQTHELCSKHYDVATTSLIENWIDETERRIWFLFETGRCVDAGGH